MLWRRKWQPTPVFLPGESRTEARTEEAGRLQSWGYAELGTAEVTEPARVVGTRAFVREGK